MLVEGFQMADRASGGAIVHEVLTQRPGSPGLVGSGGAADWFGPGNPLPPVAPPQVAGRTLDYPSAYNLNQRPRAYEPVSFDTLKMLAQNFDILRLVIETRKDQIAAVGWRIMPKDNKAKVEPGSALEREIEEVNDFFAYPDRENDWDTWVRMLVEELLVYDAPTIYPHLTYGGDLYRLKVISGATIKRIIDDWGDTPMAPHAAYQQVLHGLGAVNYTRDQLLYWPRNKRADRIYGFSPVEQVIAIVNIGLRREAWQMRFFTDGNLPDALIGTPNEWTPDQIRSFQDWFDARLEGNSGSRRGATFVPGEIAKGYVATKETELFGQAEEWIARVVCYAFNVTPQAFTMMMNRATAETQKDSSEEEGLAPLKSWVKNRMDYILKVYLKKPHLVWGWADETEMDPKVQSEILTAYQDGGILSINAIRAKIGEDPDPSPQANMLMVKTSEGWIPIDSKAAIEHAKAKAEALGPPPGTADGSGPAPGGGSFGRGGSGPKAPGAGSAEAGKAALPQLHKGEQLPPLTTDRPLVAAAEASLTKFTAKTLRATAKIVGAQLADLLAKQGVAKADDPTDHGDGDAEITPIVDVDSLVDQIDLSSLQVLVDAYRDEIYAVASDTALQSLAQVGAEVDGDLTNQVNAEAAAFASERSAEMVGMRVLPDGSMIPNPNARFAITDTTRQNLRSLIGRGLAENHGSQKIINDMVDSFGFSADRAKLIAHTEIANANEQSKLIGYRNALGLGIELKKSWLTVGDDRVEPECVANAAAGAIAIDADFPSGHDAPLAHPRCFPGSTLVQGRFIAGTKVAYEGPMREIVTRSGARLSVTPNHPIFTDLGLIPASMVQVGLYAIRYGPDVEAIFAMGTSEDNAPASIEQVFEAMRVAGASRKIEASPEDFHGDAVGFKGQVEVVAIDSQLFGDVEPSVAHSGTQSGLGIARMNAADLVSGGAGLYPLSGLRKVPSGVVGGADLSGPLGVGHPRPLQPLSVGSASNEDARRLHALCQDAAGQALPVGETLHRGAAVVFRDEVLEVRDYDFAGHVYDLQSTTGSLVADNLFTSNCRCVLVPEIEI